MHCPRVESSIFAISNQRVRAFQKNKEMESIDFDSGREDLNEAEEQCKNQAEEHIESEDMGMPTRMRANYFVGVRITKV